VCRWSDLEASGVGGWADACSRIWWNRGHLTWINDHGLANEEVEMMRLARRIASLLHLQQIALEVGRFHCDNIIMSRHLH
jgi:hypothetical protein